MTRHLSVIALTAWIATKLTACANLPVPPPDSEGFQIRPYTLFYGREYTPSCLYMLTAPEEAGLEWIDGEYVYTNALQPIHLGEPPMVKIQIKPKPGRIDCIEGEFTAMMTVDEQAGKATGDLEVPRRQPWLLVYATSAEFPHQGNPTKDASDRHVFWGRIFEAIDQAYRHRAGGTSAYWLTADAYEVLAGQSPAVLVGHELGPESVEAKGPTAKLDLSEQALLSLGEVPERGRQPGFTEYGEQIETYAKLHSTAPKKTGKLNTVVIVQAKGSFSNATCDEFKRFGRELDKAGIRVLLLHPVENIRQGTLDQRILIPVSNKLDHEDIYTCAFTSDLGSSQLIVFEYFLHMDRNHWQGVQALMAKLLRQPPTYRAATSLGAVSRKL